jgi:tripartite-type tricarboxylate transporter receptor subunit TctC
LLPDVPTINENVAPGFYLMAWFGVFAPAGTSPQIINTLSIEIQKFLLREDVKVKLNLNGVETFYAGPKEFSQFLISEEVRWTQMATAAGIAPE